MRLTINTSEAQAFALAEPGPYSMKVERAEPKKAKTGTNGVEVDFQFQDPNLQQKHGHVRRFYPIEGKGAGFFAEFWKQTTGEELPVGQEGIGLDIELDDCLEAEVQVEITNEASNAPGADPNVLYNVAKKVVAAR